MASTSENRSLSPHLSPEQIIALRDGEIDAEPFLLHLSLCDHCRKRLAEARRLAALLNAAVEKES